MENTCKECNCTCLLSYCPKAYVGKPAPEFKGTAWVDGKFIELKLSELKGKWVVLFFYPLDFTFVCPTEICNFSDSHDAFQNINTVLIGCSVDSHFSHREWALKERKLGGLKPCNIPLLSDITHQISQDYGVLIDDGPNKGVAFRGAFIIDPQGTLRQYSVNDLPVGRSVDEVLRLVQAFQFTDKHGEVCPSKWKPGAKTMITNPDAPELKKYWEEELAKPENK
jgi:alkyl hydroperoxide reductase subunit AhpC